MRIARALLLACLAAVAAGAFAQAEPKDAHPRLFLDEGTAAMLKELARRPDSVVHAAVRRCDAITKRPDEFGRDGYMGLDWAQHLQACLVAWKATDDPQFAKTSYRYFLALIDDLQHVGDGKGGDKAATRDSGFAIRALGPYTAIAYDWLHPTGLMDEAVRARARQRFRAWTDWYATTGYRNRHPGNNYHAGYVFAATMIAVAQGGEAGPDGARLWRVVVDEMFRRDLLPAARGGILVGGDWGEGWQYAPLSVAGYALSARALARYGVDTGAMKQWLGDVALRHLHARTPGGEATFAGGDTQVQTPNIGIRLDTLSAVVAGRGPDEARGWAQAEIERLWRTPPASGFLLFPALAEAEKVKAVPYTSEARPTEYLSRGTSVLFARSSWNASAVWFVAQCSKTIDVDHMPAAAGNFVLSRGGDHLLVDPSPYGSLSSLTGNAPTIQSGNLPANYVPSQAYWSQRTGFAWTTRLEGGELLVRCDYADQYRFQNTPSDIPLALRDFVLMPYTAGTDSESALLLVVDRARGRNAGQDLHLRFRSPAPIKDQAPGRYGASLGQSDLVIRPLRQSGGAPEVRDEPAGSCFDQKKNYTRGNCDAARFAVGELRQRIPGPNAMAAHLVEAGAKGAGMAEPAKLAARGAAAWAIERAGRRWVVVVPEGAGPATYESDGEEARHIVLAGEGSTASTLRVAARPVAAGCEVTLGGRAGVELKVPVAFAVEKGCAVRATGGVPVLGAQVAR